MTDLYILAAGVAALALNFGYGLRQFREYERRIALLRDALKDIRDQVTPRANGTVQRIGRMVDIALADDEGRR